MIAAASPVLPSAFANDNSSGDLHTSSGQNPRSWGSQLHSVLRLRRLLAVVAPHVHTPNVYVPSVRHASSSSVTL
ncbi:hypothetical protein PC128_g20266 [Phytophthora cactorum]|nr:hypothetical protein PC120_g25567 [Phytophthora cactorum]KAG3163993.1 hypothetical protein PC128_g20266 [Phytophthora cactorum]KAG4046063.1 hypothetical protein PC123_g18545 [Phytophthora cactorum]